MKVSSGRGIVIVIGIAIIAIVYGIWIKFIDEEIPNLIELSRRMSFDYVVVGSGTAGSVVASELARNSKSTVLLIEAGYKFGHLSKIPLLTTFTQKTQNDWGFLSSPQKFSSRGLIRKQQYLPRGRGLGGSSQINYLLHFSGYKKDFDIWKEQGAVDWSYDTMKHYLKSATSSRTTNQTSEPVTWTIPKNYSLLTEAFEKAKFEFIGRKLHFHRTQYNIKYGERWSAYQMYLRPSFILKNFKILIRTLVEKIVIKNGHARSVIVRDEYGKSAEIHAKKEIILSTGAFSTPHILQLSGIGPEKILKAINVKPIVNSPNVGENLFEHLNLPLYVSINESASLTLNKIMSYKEIWDYLTKGKGVYANFGVLGNIFEPTENYGVTLFGTGAIDESALKSLSNFKTKAFRGLFPLYYNRNQEGFVLLSTCLRPTSRGTVQAISDRIDHYPLIDLNLLHQQNDVQCTIKGIRTAVDLVLSRSFKKFNPTIHWPILDECLDFGPFREDLATNRPSDEYLECLIRTVGLASHHPGGTCSIGNRSDSCVDNKLRVQGVKGLRVVDASVLPAPISGTPNSVVMAVAKRAADLILSDT